MSGRGGFGDTPIPGMIRGPSATNWSDEHGNQCQSVSNAPYQVFIGKVLHCRDVN